MKGEESCKIKLRIDFPIIVEGGRKQPRKSEAHCSYATMGSFFVSKKSFFALKQSNTKKVYDVENYLIPTTKEFHIP